MYDTDLNLCVYPVSLNLIVGSNFSIRILLFIYLIW